MTRRLVGWLLVATQVAVYIVLALLPWRTPTLVSVLLALPLLALGVWLGLISFARLGNALTPTPVPIAGAGLRTTGPYAWLRHPIYSAVLLLTFGVVIAAGSWWSLAWAVIIAGFFWAKSRWEDSLLVQEYGEEWLRWSKQTGALIPRRRRSAP